MSDLFGHLATRFGRSPEDLATEGLCYILNHQVAGNAFVAFVNARADASEQRKLDTPLTFRTQEATEDGDGQPDMVAVSGNAKKQLLVESKFWAGLTANQPNGYLRDLEGTPGRVLLFLVPHPRREYIWPKIRKSAKEEFEVEAEDGYRLSLANGTRLLLYSWRDALNAVASAVQAEGGMRGLLEDIRQVQGLCERYSREGFVPLRGDELGQDVGKRVNQLTWLVRDLKNRLGDGWSKDSNMATSRKRYTFKTQLHGFDVFVGIMYFWWAERGQSPIWLRIKARKAGRREDVLQALKPDFQAFADKPTTYPTDVLLPLPLKLGVERDEVLDDLEKQLANIAERLSLVLTSE